MRSSSSASTAGRSDEPVRTAVALGSILLAALIYCALALSFSRIDSFYSPDCGARWWMVLYAGPHGDVAHVVYDNAGVDPSGLLHPLTLLSTHNLLNGYVAMTPHGLSVVFPPLFPYLSRLLYLRFGRIGLHALPLASGLAALAIVWATGRRLQLRNSMLLPAALGLATPLLLYSVVFWDHSIQILLTAVAACLLARACDEERPLLAAPAGCALGLGILFHELFAMLFVGVVVGAIYIAACYPMRRRFALRSAAATAAGFAPWVVCWLISNQALYGSFRGVHLAIASNFAASGELARTIRPAHIMYRFVNAFTGVETLPTALARAAVPLFLACLFVALAASPFRRRAIWPVVLAWIVAAAIAATWCRVTQSAEGLFEATPILIPALSLPALPRGARSDSGKRPSGRGMFYRWIGVACIVFFMHIVVNPQQPGMWGQRHLLMALPLLALLSARSLDAAWEGGRGRRVIVAIGVAALLASSVWSETRALTAARLRSTDFAELCDVMGQSPAPALATDCWFLYAQMADPPHLRMFQLYAGDRQPERIPEFYTALDALHIDRFAFYGSAYGLRELAFQGAHRQSPFAWRFRASDRVLRANGLVGFLFERTKARPAD
jgi:hypothetical protein